MNVLDMELLSIPVISCSNLDVKKNLINMGLFNVIKMKIYVTFLVFHIIKLSGICLHYTGLKAKCDFTFVKFDILFKAT